MLSFPAVEVRGARPRAPIRGMTMSEDTEKTEENPAPDPSERPLPETLEEAIAELAALRESLATQQAEATANHELFVRERAELENFKRRMMREKSEALRFASESLLRDLLGSLDNLERAIEHAEGDGAVAAVREGVQMVLSELGSTLERHGVTRIEARGRPFDPAEHEALAQIPTTLTEAGHVIDEHRAGFRLHDRLLRAAQVTVAQQPTAETEGK